APDGRGAFQILPDRRGERGLAAVGGEHRRVGAHVAQRRVQHAGGDAGAQGLTAKFGQPGGKADLFLPRFGQRTFRRGAAGKWQGGGNEQGGGGSDQNGRPESGREERHARRSRKTAYGTRPYHG